MKNVFLLAMFLVVGVNLNAQTDAITRFFDKYVEDERFSVVFISSKMFDLVAKVEAKDEDWEATREIVKDLRGLRVLIGEDMDGVALYKEALKKVPAAEYSELLTVRDKDEHVRIWIHESSEKIIDELLILVGSPDEFVLVSLLGRIDLDKISELSNTIDVEGVQHLGKIKSKK